MKRKFVFSFSLITCIFILSSCVAPVSSASGVSTTSTGTSLQNQTEESIEILYPLQNQTVDLSNAEVREFCSQYSNGIGRNYAKGTDHYYMKGVTMRWSCLRQDSIYKIQIATRADLKESQIFYTDTNELQIDDLFVSTTYYVQVSAETEKKTICSDLRQFQTADSPRTIEIGGVSNSRDIGGKLTTDGKRIRQGFIYRSANYDTVSSMGRTIAMNRYGIRSELDLRYNHPGLKLPKEGLVGTDILGTGRYHTIQDADGILGGAMYIQTDASMSLDKEKGKEALKKEFECFGEKENYPIVFHCKIGRDRTGLLSMLLLSLLNASETDIFMDYELSAFSASGSGDGQDYSTLVQSRFRPTFEYLKSFDGDTLSQKCQHLLLDAGIEQATIDQIKEIMLEDII